MKAKLIVRSPDSMGGFKEEVIPVKSFEELIAICAELAAPKIVDRLQVAGLNKTGEECLVAFEFKSMLT